ncbi:MAG: FAD-dependent oxidoreductase [Pseudorhodoplanes sp.]|uniref:FAD-dependent oxidoreductase n=1 Tax=Pseudorhodoplanes sp. TaxID=1934341 RepID=UPI003D127F18
MTAKHDVIIIGSGAGGSSVAYQLALAGKQVLLIEKGPFLPRDASTLSVRQVFVDGVFKNHTVWHDAGGRDVVPSEFYNVGGKTKWYGAALFRFRPVEFEAEPDFDLLDWPFGYDELEPYYDQATELLRINTFTNEPELQALLDRITTADPGWKLEPLPLGLSKDILTNPDEAKHFDGFASPSGYKSDAERNLIDHIRGRPNFKLIAGDPVAELVAAPGDPRRIIGVKCADGSTHEAQTIVLAAGAMTSPRILQDYLRASEITLPCGDLVGANFKMHMNSAVLGFSPFKDHDVLRKTAVLFNDKFPHSSMQCLGWIDEELLATQVPPEMPRFLDRFLGKRAIGFWATTEDSSSPQNRIISGGPGGQPVMDYSLDRMEKARKEHQALVDAWIDRLLHAGLVGFEKYMGLAGTAHALGSMVTGSDPSKSVIDPHGKVHGMEGLYVGDGSALPRASRVNPSLTIYAWGLRLGKHLAATG